MLTLYSMPSSGNSYKVRLLLAHLGLIYTHVDCEEGSAQLARLQGEGRLPRGKVPVLELEDGTLLTESNAILCYLAEGSRWMPEEALARAEVLAWMFWEQNSHEPVIAVRAALFAYPKNAHLKTPERLAELLDAGQDRLVVMEDALAGRDWLAGPGGPTIADICLYAYTHTAETKGGFDLSGMPRLRDWLDRMAALPGHVALTDLSGSAQ